MNDTDASPLRQLREWDERRPSLPGEHWMTGALGVYLLLQPRRSIGGRLASVGLGALLIARALSGRDGAIASLKRLSDSLGEREDYVDVAATWPYRQRVRISAPRRVERSAKATGRVDERAPIVSPS